MYNSNVFKHWKDFQETLCPYLENLSTFAFPFPYDTFPMSVYLKTGIALDMSFVLPGNIPSP